MEARATLGKTAEDLLAPLGVVALEAAAWAALPE
jgi:hypothetical protein